MKKYLEYAGLVALTLVLAYLFIPTKTVTYGSATGYDSLNLTPSASTGDSYAVAVAGNSVVDMNGSLIAGRNQTNGQGLFLGGTTTNYNITQVVFATSTFATTTFGAVTSATGTLFTQVAFLFPNLGTDDTCMASLTSAPTSTAFSIEAFISSATATNATSSLLIENGTSTVQTIGAGMITVVCLDPSF